jgi:hypothetical protein
MNSLRPGDFPIGSALSRVAARLLMEERHDTRKRIEIVTNVAFIYEDEAGRPLDKSKPQATPWTGNAETLVRILCVPDGMTKEEAQSIVDRTN